ncbi:hypothetical protein FOXG_16406 [Fusarium oxysporum f. sp. lycopersici 4287]|uniref:Uncharacterized protein n=2 Tax=Fusarium oxysporum TaxID=5507 RepID=A0A0J9W8V6_FUSO4|nr:hypothetical protein FOXG_16406 [Fusarium oxysporum f. sp. lycopersici 4287]KAJ9413760.1 hypothetical protein QL093DRAFT_2493319 [Fusarium oxysporum]KNB19248.1 hypothetical protein FOXG_16406 [Fusarium oxysporum f. sp. lycopersici 4287]
MHHSTHFLMDEYGETLGELWGALASVKHYPRPIPRNDGTPEAKRARRGVVHTGYVHSAGIQVSSSNPEDRNHSSPGGSEGSTGYTETKPTQELPAEDNALHLINRVLRHLLYYTQPLNASPVLDLRQKCRMVSQISELKKQFVAVDDGGLILRVEGGVSTGPHIAIALLEAKRRLVVDDNKPRISDECLAQMTCEAILARAIPAEEQLGNERTIVLNATSHYVCFLEFNVTKAYMRRLMAGQLPSESLKVTATHWFDLSAVEGRRGVLNNIRGLLGMAMDRQPQQDVISDSEGVED